MAVPGKETEPEKKAQAFSGFKVFWTTIKRSWRLFRRSKLGLLGTAIILVFIFMAVFAPWVAPYSPEFLAPNVDIFVPVNYGKTYVTNGTFHEPVVGASSPNDPTENDGRLWIILADDLGIIRLDSVSKNETPFTASTKTVNITEYGLSPPISNVLWLSPGRLRTGLRDPQDDLTKNGLLGFVANRYLVLLDPFNRRVILKQYIGFQPTWFVNDPVSAGNMYDAPQRLANDTGVQHCFHYIVAATDTHVSAFSVDYRSSQDDPVMPPDGFQTVLSLDMPVTGLPLAYFLKGQKFRSGIFIPTSNNKLRYFTLNASREYNLTLSIDGEPANISAPIGYRRSVELQMLYVPLKSATKTAVWYLVPQNIYTGVLQVPYKITFNDPTAVVTSQPDPNNLDTPQFVVTHYDHGNATRSELHLGNATGALDPILNVSLSKPVISSFYSNAGSAVFALDTDGRVWSASTVSETILRRKVEDFFQNAVPTRKELAYMGTWAGTKYASALSKEELVALVFEPETGRVLVFKLLGASRAPLPPGTYPSGNTYFLGTDAKGGDILTQLIWGSRVALSVGVLAALFSVVIGTLVGLVAGFYGGILDTMLMRVTDIALVLPFLPLVLVLAQILGPSILTIVIVIAVLGWPGIARVIRAQTLSLKERPFVDAARISGASRSRIMMVHIAPNVLPFSFLYMTLSVGGAILTEAAVSFLGFGDPRPQNVSWGTMLSTLSSSGTTLTAWWWLLPPGLCITLISLGFYLVGRAIDEIINPRLRER